MATRESQLTIRTDFGNAGLDTSGSRVRTDESSLWQSKNAVSDFRGTLRKRYFMSQLGTDIIEPTDVVSSNNEMISIAFPATPTHWVPQSYIPDNSQLRATRSGLINFYSSTSAAVGTATHRLDRMLRENESYNTNPLWDGDFSFGLTIQTASLFANSVVTGTETALYYSAACTENKAVKLAFSQAGMWVKASAGNYVLATGTAGVADGALHSIRVEFRKSGVLYLGKVYLDDVLVDDTITVGLTLLATTDEFLSVEIIGSSTLGASELCAGNISAMWLRDTADLNIVPAVIETVFARYKYVEESPNEHIRVYAATQQGIWFRDDGNPAWVYAGDNLHEHVRSVDFRDSAITINYGAANESVLTQILNDFSTRVLDDAPNIRFAVTHTNRLWGAGDPKYPLRVYFSGDRAPNVWFSPDTDADGQETIDEVLGAGYFEMDSHTGDSVTALWGDFRGNIIVCTRAGKTFRIAGNSLSTWYIEKLDDASGALGPECIERVGNDLWIVGESGVYTLQAVQEFGDMAVKRISLPIQNVFSKVGSHSQILVPQLSEHTALMYEKSTDTVYLILRQPTGWDDTVFTFRLGTGKWQGPWELGVTTASVGPIVPPMLDTMVIGNGDGQVLFRTDRSDPAAEVVIESPVLTGRSIDPKVTAMEKLWKNFRLLVNPTGDHTITFRYKVEDGDWQTRTKKLARNDSTTMGTDFTIGTSQMESEEELHVIDFIIGTKGRTLKWDITTSDPKISFIAAELEFVATGYNRGD
jgi:hypothetical protein